MTISVNTSGNSKGHLKNALNVTHEGESSLNCPISIFKSTMSSLSHHRQEDLVEEKAEQAK